MLNATHVSKSFNGLIALNDVSFTVNEGTIVALLGPSGSGKSTLLRCISRLEKVEKGSLTFQKKSLDELSSCAIGMVFQGFHLFPHMTVVRNIAHAPTHLKRLGKTQAEAKARELLEKFGLADKADQFPSQLSGGQKQRVAIARALIVDPPLLLFDEPTSALDPEMVYEIADLIKSLKSPNRLIIMATHELRLAKLAADQVLFLDHGKLIENAPKSDFFDMPKTPRVQQFIKNLTIA